jgi:hypothetical protein
MAIRKVHLQKIINVPFFIMHSCKLNDFDAGMVGQLQFQRPKKLCSLPFQHPKKA